MSLTNRFPLTKDGNDIIGGIVSTNNGGVTFDPNNGASFNGTNQHLSFTKTIPTAFSFTIWINTTNFTSNTSGCSLFGGADTYIDISGGYIRDWYYSMGSQSLTADFNPANFPASIFTPIIFTYDGINTTSLYRNTTLMITRSDRSLATGLSTSFNIGGYIPISNGYFAGRIKDVRIYNHCLSSTEIASLVLAGANNVNLKQLNIPAFCQTSIERL